MIQMTSLRRRVAAVLATVVAAVALVLAPTGFAQATGPGSVSVTVTEGGAPVASLGIALQGPDSGFVPTDGSGTAAFSDLALGDYTVTAYASGAFQETSVSFTLTSEQPSWSGTLAREPWPTGTGSIQATVVDATTELPVAGAHVTVSRTDAVGPLYEGTTDANGVLTVTGLVPGTYLAGTDATPEYLGATVWGIDVADGQVSTTILVLAADATITGRVVGPDGVGVPGLFVNAQQSGPFFGWVSGFTDADGYYVLEDAAAGIWTVGTWADSNWENASIQVDVAAGTTTTAADLVLTPRFTGTISGLVATSDGIAEAQDGGFFDVRVTVLEADGTPVPGASLVTGGDGFYYFWLAPGAYTVYFEDVDADRSPHRYAPVYLGGATTLAEASTVTVETLVDSWLDTTVLSPDLGDPEPTYDATPAPKKELTKAKKGRIAAPDKAHRGDTVTVSVGTEYAGTWVSAWIYSAPQQLGGWHQVAADGTIEVQIPSTAPLGSHRLSVQNADDAVIGWTKVQIKK
jgi:hypothetical protein